MRISFIIPAYNEERCIADCLRSIVALRDPCVHEIIVVNNASTDATANVAASIPGVRVVDEPIKGLARARKRGLSEATGDLFASIDADTTVTPEWLARVKKAFGSNSSLVCLSGPYIHDIPSWQEGLKEFLERCAHAGRRFTGRRELRISGGNAVYRTAALRATDAFDESILFYGEDVETARRIRAAGAAVFDRGLIARTSGRRIVADGFFRHFFLYKLNTVWQTAFGKPLLRKVPRDYR